LSFYNPHVFAKLGWDFPYPPIERKGATIVRRPQTKRAWGLYETKALRRMARRSGGDNPARNRSTGGC